MRNTIQKTKQMAAYLIASFFGTGYLPWMPGTWGTLAAMLVAYVLLDPLALAHLPRPHLCLLLALVSVITFLSGWWATQFCYKKDSTPTSKPHFDPSWIVMDEVAGYFFTLAIISWFRPIGILALSVAFIFFRFFDICKPFPINWLEKKCGAHPQTVSLGVMADDMLAAVLAGLCALVALY